MKNKNYKSSKKKNYSKGEIAKIILKTILVGGFVISCMIAPGFAMAGPLFGFGNRSKLNRSLYRLKRKKYIEIYDRGNRTYFEITESGKRKLLKFDYDDIEIRKPNKWDSLWRLVVFDIPENKKRIREELRLKLKDLDFYKYQNSVFVYPYECKNEIDFIKEYNLVRNNVNYLVVKELDREEELKKLFKLK